MELPCRTVESERFTIVEFISVISGPKKYDGSNSPDLRMEAIRSGLVLWSAWQCTGHTFATGCLSGPTSRVAIANRRLTDIPHINTPVMLSIGPNIRHFSGRVTSP
jgi:hypothetical protein